MAAKRYPKKIATVESEPGIRRRRVVMVYETAKGRWRLYLKVDGKFIGSQVVTRSRASALATARAWT